MGYFSNGTEGEMYYERYCSRCVHDADPENNPCMVWGAHLIANYEECNKPESVLHMLIPRTKNDLGNEQCRMFIERDTTGDLFEGQT